MPFLFLHMEYLTYKEQLKRPEWQKKRLEIFERDNYTCQICGDKETELQVHHKEYDKTYKKLAWEYPEYIYQTLCCDCHKAITEHLKEYGNVIEFDVMKIKRKGKPAIVFVYSNGKLIFNTEQVSSIEFSENTISKIVQFLINNWAKNG